MRFLLRSLGHHRLGRDQESGDRGRALQRVTHDLRWVDDALAREIPVLARLSVVAEGIGHPFENLPDNHRAIFASIDGDQAGRPG